MDGIVYALVITYQHPEKMGSSLNISYWCEEVHHFTTAGARWAAAEYLRKMDPSLKFKTYDKMSPTPAELWDKITASRAQPFAGA
jgi:hypothetical protein